jgi:hypothetical protein
MSQQLKYSTRQPKSKEKQEVRKMMRKLLVMLIVTGVLLISSRFSYAEDAYEGRTAGQKQFANMFSGHGYESGDNYGYGSKFMLRVRSLPDEIGKQIWHWKDGMIPLNQGIKK